MSSAPPFRRTGAREAIAAAMRGAPASADAAPQAGDGDIEVDSPGRTRLADLDPHLHCSVIGTCLGTAELRKLMARFIDVAGATDLVVHHEAVRCTSSDAAVAKALAKALDCIDHDAANALKRACLQHGIRFVPLRTASVASFAAALAHLGARPGDDDPGRTNTCRKHG